MSRVTILSAKLTIHQLSQATIATFVMLSSLCFALPVSAGILIDDFAQPGVPDALVGAFGGFDSRNDGLLSPIPYPYSNRDTTVTASATGVISATIGGGQIIDISAFNTGGVVQLNYTLPLPSPVNFFAGGATHFAFDLLSSANNGVLNVTLVANGVWTTGPVSIPSNGSAMTFTVPIPLNPNFAAASFFDVFVELQGGATSLSIDEFYTTAIPEPTTAFVWGIVVLGAVGLVSIRRDSVL